MTTKYLPRSDFVLVRVTGDECIVEGLGEDVDDLNVGDKVLITNSFHPDERSVPDSMNLVLVKQTSIIAVIREQ